MHMHHSSHKHLHSSTNGNTISQDEGQKEKQDPFFRRGGGVAVVVIKQW